MIIDENIVWFIIDLVTHHEKNNATYQTIISHRTWKIRAHLTYKTECSIYYDKKIAWKYNLFLQVIDTNFDKVIWPSSFFSIETLFTMTISKRREDDDYKKMMKREKVFNEETLIKYIESIEQDLTSAVSVFQELNMTDELMPNASDSDLTTISLETSTSAPEQGKSSAIFFEDTVVVTKWISSFDINTESNSQNWITLTTA